jgi:hypothetical protein
VTRRLSWLAGTAGLLFFVAHLPFLTWFLDDIDAINFALGIRLYDIAHHRPHPPGYPLFIACGKILTWLFATVGWHPRGEIEAGAMSFCGVLAGALAAVALVLLFYRLEGSARRAGAAMLLTLASPLYWFTSARPLSDVPGLALALAAQAVLAGAFLHQQGWKRQRGPTDAREAEPEAPGGAGAAREAAIDAASGARRDAATDAASGARRDAATDAASGARRDTATDAASSARRDAAAGERLRAGSAIDRNLLLASGRLIVLGAFLAGFAAGLRSQSVWLTLPLLILVITDRVGRGAAGAILGSTITFGLGAVLWFVPMVIVSGGPAAYLQALSSQANEDFSGVDMLYTSAQPVTRLAANLWETFLSPWVSMPLAFLVLGLAAIGFIAMAWRSRRGLVLLLGLWTPYAILHLLFQENETIRYALPLVAPVAYLAVRGLDALVSRLMPVGAAILVIASLIVGVPALAAYAPTRPPVFALFEDMSAAAAAAPTVITPTPTATTPTAPTPPTAAAPTAASTSAASSASAASAAAATSHEQPLIAMHRRVLTESRRAREWRGAAFPWTVLPAPVGHEWLELEKTWREGSRAPIWFVADPRRTDLALIDPASRRAVRHYAWTVQRVAADPLSQRLAQAFPRLFQAPALVGGARPDEMDWYVLAPPQWFLGEGWALTPETSGVADREKKGPGQPAGAVGYVRRRPEATRLVIGGRNLGAATEPPVRFALDLDGRTLDTWDVAPNPGFFLRAIALPAGALTGAGEFGTLTVHARRADGATPDTTFASIEQFDLQPAGDVLFGYDTGWHESEHDPRTGRMWRWASDASSLRIWNGDRDVHVRIVAESPLRYFAAAPEIVLRVGATDIKRVSPRADFTIEVDVSAALLAQAGGIVTLATNEVFVPAERVRGSTDRRRLGLRVYDVAVTPK